MFVLHPKLAEDTFHLGDFPLSQLLLMNDANYPWFILVPRRASIREIYQLDSEDQQQLLKESSQLARQLNLLFKADKLNIAALGNIVPQLHLHHIVRYNSDATWPNPVWGQGPPLPYETARILEIREILAAKLENYTAS
ncbi:MAG: HIT domain-containing protein [Desulfuromonadales bacterium]|nr:HIT domain-containing protein [Desulfuromonadales bacterium]